MGERTQLELADPKLGLVGKVDAIRRRDGSLIPYEHKRGKARRDGKVAVAWPSARFQMVAYAVSIESSTGETIPEGRVRYHADNATIRVAVDSAARADLAEAIATARRLRVSPDRPPVTANDRLCARCSLAPVCLPEETRQAEHPDRRALAFHRSPVSSVVPAPTSSSLAIRTIHDFPQPPHRLRLTTIQVDPLLCRISSPRNFSLVLENRPPMCDPHNGLREGGEPDKDAPGR